MNDSVTDDELIALYPRATKPTIRVNFVSSLDGAVEVDGLSAGLSGAADKRVFRLLRMLCDAVVVGAGTFRKEKYRPLRLDEDRRRWRLEHGLPAYPRLVVVSKSGDVDLSGHEDPVLLRDIDGLKDLGLDNLLCEGGPQLFGAIMDQVDELCLTLSPLLAGPGSGRIIAGSPVPPKRMNLAHCLTTEDGTILLRYVRQPSEAAD